MLNNINNKNPFKVPENYFENFQADMIRQIEQTSDPVKKVVPLWKKVLPWTGVAAVACGLIISFSIFFNASEQSTTVEGKNTELYASSSEDDYFMMFLEDQVINTSYDEVVYTSYNN